MSNNKDTHINAIISAVNRLIESQATAKRSRLQRNKSITSKTLRRDIRNKLAAQYGTPALHVCGIDDIEPLPACEWIPATRQLFLDVPK